MKTKLFILTALVLTSISSIFFNISTDVSAERYGEDFSSYEDSYNNEYSQEDYSTYKDDYSDESYGDNSYPPKEPKKFTCPDSGILVDKPAHCPRICPEDTDLAGHFIAANSDPEEVCDTELPPDGNGNGEGECLKCVDLAIAGGSPPGQLVEFAEILVAPTTTTPGNTNIFDLCAMEDPREAFADIVDVVLPPPSDPNTDTKELFNDCIENAPGLSVAALQENSFTTNVKPESEISTSSSAQAQAQGTEELSASALWDSLLK